MNHYRSVTRGAALRLACLGALLSSASASAQTAAGAPGDKDDTAVKLEKFVVTGSYIPYAADAPATPVTIIGAQEIANTGIGGDLLEVIRKTVPQFSGNKNLGSSNANISSGSTNGGSQISLRNTNTLVLVNGRRAAFAPASATGGFTFVDVNAIPVSAVERIEVVTDGASATYGSDAVSGVVNIILKSSYNGFEFGGAFKHGTRDGNWEERSARFTTGASVGKTKVTLTGEWVKSDPIYQYERDFSSPAFGTPTFPGVVQIGGTATGRYYLLNTSLNAPPLNTDLSEAQLVANGTYRGNPATGAAYTLSEIAEIFDLSRYVTLQLSNDKKSLVAAFEHEFSDKVTLFGDVMYSSVSTYSQLNAQPLTNVTAQTHAASDPRNPFNITVRARNRFTDYPRIYLSDNDSLRLVAGMRGAFANGWNWEVAANHNSVNQLFRNQNVIDRAAFAEAVADGTINMFAYRQAAGAIESANAFGTAYSINDSTLRSFDARVFGDIEALKLPGGPVSFAVGAEMRRETLKAEPDSGSYTNPAGEPARWDGATVADPFYATRDIDSVFAQVRLPLADRSSTPGFYTFDIDLSLRMDKYSDTEDPNVPKVLIRWLPFDDQFAVRATYSESFTAPSLYQLFGPAGIGFTDEIVNFRGADGVTYPSLAQFDYKTLTSRALRPETSKNYNVGIVYSPKALKGAKFELSYFSLDQSDIISRVAAQTILQDVELNGTASQYASYVRFGSFGGSPVTATGQVVNSPADLFLTNPLVNFVSQTQSGLDLNASYTWTSDELGRFDFAVQTTWWDSYEVNGLETVGLATITNGTIPDYVMFGSVNWSRGGWSAGASMQHMPGVDETIDGTLLSKVGSFTSVDVRLGYTFGRSENGLLNRLDGLSVRLGANNVFDKNPPLAPSVFSDANADVSTYYAGMIGRVVYLDVTYKF